MNSTTNITNVLNVGKEGTGVLDVQAGGRLIVGKNFGLGDTAKGNGTATVSGAGSTINATQGVIVGNQGTGTLNVQNGGKVTGAGLAIGQVKGSTGMVTVTGANSTVELGGNVFVGYKGKGTLDLQAGGSLTTTKRVGIGASFADGEGKVTIVGDGSVLKAEKVIVGGKGTGTLMITDKGMAQGDVDVRAMGTLQGKANVKGTVTNMGGTVAQGPPGGEIHIDGSYTQSLMGTLVTEIAGRGVDRVDLVDIIGPATINPNSVFDFAFINGFTPEKGDVFPFLTASGGVSSLMDPIMNISGAPTGLEFAIVDTSSSLELVVLNDSQAVAVSEPGGLVLLASGALVLFGYGGVHRWWLRGMCISSWRRNRHAADCA
jgi:T5SS/PEP-CTERM-associated repeat protein